MIMHLLRNSIYELGQNIIELFNFLAQSSGTQCEFIFSFENSGEYYIWKVKKNQQLQWQLRPLFHENNNI